MHLCHHCFRNLFGAKPVPEPMLSIIGPLWANSREIRIKFSPKRVHLKCRQPNAAFLSQCVNAWPPSLHWILYSCSHTRLLASGCWHDDDKRTWPPCRGDATRRSTMCINTIHYSVNATKQRNVFLEIYWNRIVVILTTFSPLAEQEVVILKIFSDENFVKILITSNAARDENFVKMTIFPFQIILN